ncbi:MAG: adenylosuccinate synthase [Planctomycetes bacterium]|jgi:adenylosuccinate synthase|nr:adenylosuccinate synthase [Planctomycetota bacterium]
MNTCIVGLQWGDEGKGKVVDLLAEDSDIVVRYGGGSNAGHTVVIGEERFALHLLPSGSVRAGVMCVIANAVVVDPAVLIGEIDGLALRGIALTDRLLISENAHVVLDYHKREDQLREESLGKEKLGTTVRGIGPCYADKVGRSYAVRMSDFCNLPELDRKLRTILAYKNKLFAALYGAEPISIETVMASCRQYAERLVPFVRDTTEWLHHAIARGQSVLFEGAQGSLLDLDHGTFPYVTSSNASSLGVPAGCGVPARMIEKYIGVAKAYTTRVGAGPFPTEQENETGQYIREKGHEYGTTTGRPRRCGWFDAVAAAYSVKIGSIDALALLHLDTLGGLKKLSLCSAYEIDGRRTTFFPANIDRLARAKPIYEQMAGWDEDISQATTFEDLPANAQAYVRRIETLIGKPVEMIGVGPKRSQTIIRK